MSEFIECHACAAKPGSPELCCNCLRRRKIHYNIHEDFDDILNELEAAANDGLSLEIDAGTIDIILESIKLLKNA